MDQSNHFDVVIIGAGISGLTSAGLFSRLGYRVCILEMDARPGGYIAGFKRLDYRFDSAIHWLNQCGPNGLITKAFQFIGHDFPKCEVQHLVRRYKLDDMDYLVTTNVDDFMNELIRDFPEDEKGIRRFFRDAKRIGKSFVNFTDINRNMSTMGLFEKALRGMKMLKFVIPFIPHISYSGDEGVKKGLKKYFTNEKLMRLFGAEHDLLSCLIPIAWAHIQDFQYPPKGGSQTFAEWLAHVTYEYNNEIRFQSKVKEIILENNKAVGVRFDQKKKSEVQEVYGKYIVAACDVETLYEKMLPKGIVPDKRLNVLKKAELYASAVTLSIALDCTAESLGFGKEMYYIADGGTSRDDLGNGNPATSGIHVVASSTRDTSMAPEGKGTLTIFIPGWLDKFNNWGTTVNDKGELERGEAYKDLKNEVSNIVIDRVDKKFGLNLREHIVYLDIATPVTHLRYTGNRGGTMMGARPGKANMQARVAHYKTPVENLFLSGHWAELGGGIPVAVRAALNSTLLILKKEDRKKFRLLANYVDGKLNPAEIEASHLTERYANNWTMELTPAEKKAERLAGKKSKNLEE